MSTSVSGSAPKLLSTTLTKPKGMRSSTRIRIQKQQRTPKVFHTERHVHKEKQKKRRESKVYKIDDEYGKYERFQLIALIRRYKHESNYYENELSSKNDQCDQESSDAHALVEEAQDEIKLLQDALVEICRHILDDSKNDGGQPSAKLRAKAAIHLQTLVFPQTGTANKEQG
jgi:hypothetical protein